MREYAQDIVKWKSKIKMLYPQKNEKNNEKNEREKERRGTWE